MELWALKRLPTDSVEVEPVKPLDFDSALNGAAQRPLAGGPVRPGNHLFARLGDRPLRFPLRLLHGEHMAFLPKAELLTLEELDRLCSAFVARGVRKLRLTGGEPLVRRGIMTLFSSLSRHLETGRLDELTLTTNGSQLAKFAANLKAHGVQRINVSLDTLDPDKFRAITRWGALHDVLAGIDAAQSAGLKIKINTVALKGVNEDEFPRLVEWAHGRGMDLTLIEVMPLGEIGRRSTSICRCRWCARVSRERFSLDDLDYRTGGPARYVGSPRPAAGSASSRR